jgi:pimeloyl-ACP methyl ester carboxylesterase
VAKKNKIARKVLAGGILAAASAYLGLCAFLYANQDAMVLPGASLNLPVAEIPGVEVSWLTLSDGTKLRGGRALPQTGEEGETVLYFGGNAEDATAILPELALATGRVAVAYNYRGFAGSGGEPSLERFEADAVEVYRHVAAGSGSRSGEASVALLGRSIGTGAALAAAAAKGPAADALALVSPYDSLGAVAAEAFPFFPVRALLRQDVNAQENAALVPNRVLIILAGKDAEISNERSLSLADAFPVAPELLKIPESGHNSVLANPEAWRRLSEFLEARQRP